MGEVSVAGSQGVNTYNSSPKVDEIEVSFFGPGYGECILIHIGEHKWIVVDSCFNTERHSVVLDYLNSLGVNPSEAVCLVVATHWHDDHIRGIGELVEVCDKAIFCCASALGKEEFLSALAALERRPATSGGSGLRELFNVFSLLAKRKATCKFAISNRLILNQNDCMIWSLSPSDKAYEAFLQQIAQLIPREEGKRRIPSLMPNEAAVVLLVTIRGTTILLGADLEKRGWLEVLDSSTAPNRKASVFKIPHHGSENAHEDRVWNEMLEKEPIVALTPWRRGGRELPTKNDARRILSFSSRAFATVSKADAIRLSRISRNNTIDKTIREIGAKIRSVGLSDGMIRLRKKANSEADWEIERFGSACRLLEYSK